MAKRDPAKTTRNKQAEALDERLAQLLPDVLELTGCENVHQLNAKIGSKYQQLVNVKERCVLTSDEFLSLYMDALAKEVRVEPPPRNSAFYRLAKWYQEEASFQQYMEKFVERTFLRHYDEIARVKPPASSAAFWIGENNADYGLLITPRFNKRLSDWENDKSEIRRFKPDYYTIGHILETGLVIPGKERRRGFEDVDDYLGFFQDTLVRNAGSKHQDAVAERYAAFVRDAEQPEKVPLLIPELRYRGRDKQHKHRLDFCVIDPYSLRKIGFELSPWSSHGHLKGTRNKTVKAVNAEARENFEREVKKLRAYFIDYDIHITIFTDEDLADPDGVFTAIAKYLRPERRPKQLLLHSRQQLLEMDLDAEVEDESSEDE